MNDKDREDDKIITEWENKTGEKDEDRASTRYIMQKARQDERENLQAENAVLRKELDKFKQAGNELCETVRNQRLQLFKVKEIHNRLIGEKVDLVNEIKELKARWEKLKRWACSAELIKKMQELGGSQASLHSADAESESGESKDEEPYDFDHDERNSHDKSGGESRNNPQGESVSPQANAGSGKSGREPKLEFIKKDKDGNLFCQIDSPKLDSKNESRTYSERSTTT
jgi:hypothetical protein